MLRHTERVLYIWKNNEIEMYLVYIVKDRFPVNTLALISNRNDKVVTSSQSEVIVTSFPVGKSMR